MRNGIKRFIAALLLVCTLASFVVPATFADTPASGAIVYDLEVYNNDRYKPMIGTRETYALSRNAENALTGVYTQGQSSMSILAADYPDALNWKIEALAETMTAANLTLYASANTGVRIRKDAPATGTSYGWIAFRLNVPNGGIYDLGLVTESTMNPNETYMFPASAASMTVEEIETQMTGGNLVGTHSWVNEPGTLTYSNINVAEGGEYILVLKTPETTARTTIYLSQITLTLVSGGAETTVTTKPAETTVTTAPETTTTAPETTTTAPVETTEATTAPVDSEKLYTDYVYDIEVYNYDRYKPMVGSKTTFALSSGAASALAGAYNSGKLSNEILSEDYPNVLNWKVEGFDSSMKYGNLTLYASANTGMRIQKLATDQPEIGWIAFRITVPEGGKYDLSAVTESSWVAHSVYVFPADAGTMSDTVLEGKMTGGNLVGTAAATSNHTADAPYNKTYQNVELAVGGEYIVAFKMSETTAKSTIYLSSFALTPVSGGEGTTTTTQAPETTVTTAPVETTDATIVPDGAEKLYTDGIYNFEIYEYDRYAPMFGTRTDFGLSRGSEGVLAGVYDRDSKGYEILAADYPNVLNWKVEGFDSSMTYSNLTLYPGANTGMRIQKLATDQPEIGWVAFRITVPEGGKYDLSAVTESSWVAHSVYVFPAENGAMDEAALEGKMTGDYLVGTPKATSKHTADAPYAESYRNIEIATAGEYIVVFKMQETASKSTIYLSGMALTPATGEVGPTEPETQPTEPEVLIPGGATKENFFDLELYRYEAFANLAGSDIGYTKAYNATDTVVQYLEKSYPDNVNWQIEGFTKGSSIYFRGAAKQGIRAEVGSGNYIAFRVNVAKAANYHIALSTSYNLYPYQATAYMLPAPEGKMTNEQILAAITDANKLGDYAFTSDNLNCAFLDQKVEKAGEYVLIFVAGERERIYLSSIDFREVGVEAPKQEQDKILYDFNLYGLDEGIPQRGFGNWLDENKSMKISKKVEKLYEAGKLHWKYEGRSETAIDEAIREKYLRFKSTVDMLEVENGWNAFRLKAPGTGKYDVRLTGIEKNVAVINFYLIPAVTGVSMTAQQIEAGMVKENLLIEKARISGEDTFYLGEYTFGAEQEYVLVLEFIRGTRLNLVSMEMTKDGLVADGTLPVGKTYSGIVYDFDLCDPFEGPFYEEKSYYMADVLDRMQSRWNSGASNWMWINASNTLVGSDSKGNTIPGKYLRFYREGGMYIYGEQDAWAAFKIKSPGSGDYTVTMNHAICPDSGTIAMYILPADTDPDKLWEATDSANRVGMVTLTNDTGLAGKEDGYTSFVGYYNFEAGKEYILLLEGYAASKYNVARANMNISQIFMEKGIKEYEKAEETKVVNPITTAKDIVRTADMGEGNFACFEMNGMDYYLVQLEGGTILLYNLDTGELEDEQFVRGSRPRHMQVAADGTVWLTNAWKFLVRYDPVNKTIEKTRPYMPSDFKHNGFAHMTFDENGVIYAALNNIGHVVKYDPATKIYTDLGVIRGVTDAVTTLTYKDGYLYIVCLQKGEYNCLVKYNIAAGKTEAICEFMHLAGDSHAYGIGFLGEDIISVGVKTTDNTCAVTIDINTMELVDLGLPGYVNHCPTEVIDGKQYVICGSYGLYEYDVATGVMTKVPGFTSMTASGFRSGGQSPRGKSFVTLDGDFCLLSNTSSKVCCPRVINMVTKEYYEWRDLTRDAVGGGSELISLTTGAEGANEVIAGFWNAHYAATYNTQTGTVTNITETAGQTDTIGFYKGILYAGCYSATVLVELERDRNEYIQRFKLDHDITKQKRLFSIEFGDDKVFVGSIPDTNHNGGSLTVYDTLTGQWYSERNLIPDQSIIDEAYWNKVVFITSGRAGGSNTVSMGGDAVILAYDYENRKTLATLDITKYIPNLPRPVEYMYGLTADPNAEENGRIWAVVADTLFCFTFDKETNTFNVQVVLSFERSAYNTSGGIGRQQSKLQFIKEKNQLYVVFKDSGTYCLTLDDWNAPVGKVKIAEKERIMGHKPEDYIIAEDGNMYFGDGGDLMMLPLNVTDEDWAIGQQVDDLIAAIGNEVTLESETAIKTARSAYENLGWYYKALVQDLVKLEEAEVDLLECKIAAWEGKEITADDVPALQELMDTYKPLNVRQKRYVKNYTFLRDSYDLASALNDKRVAEAMQKKVDALKELFPITSLDDEPQVVAVRTEFDALEGSQQYLVDTTILKEAEAQIAVLRAELVKQVEALIQAIPAEITLEAEPAIVAAREGVDKLYTLERKQVSYTKLEAAEAKLRNLKNALAKAEEVDALIKAIGIVTLGDEARIAEARKYYNALNETARSFVTKYGKLRRAEFILSALQSWGIPVIVVADLGIAFAVVWFIPSLHKKVFKTKKKEEIDS